MRQQRYSASGGLTSVATTNLLVFLISGVLLTLVLVFNANHNAYETRLVSSIHDTTGDIEALQLMDVCLKNNQTMIYAELSNLYTDSMIQRAEIDALAAAGNVLNQTDVNITEYLGTVMMNAMSLSDRLDITYNKSCENMMGIAANTALIQNTGVRGLSGDNAPTTYSIGNIRVRGGTGISTSMSSTTLTITNTGINTVDIQYTQHSGIVENAFIGSMYIDTKPIADLRLPPYRNFQCKPSDCSHTHAEDESYIIPIVPSTIPKVITTGYTTIDMAVEIDVRYHFNTDDGIGAGYQTGDVSVFTLWLNEDKVYNPSFIGTCNWKITLLGAGTIYKIDIDEHPIYYLSCLIRGAHDEIIPRLQFEVSAVDMVIDADVTSAETETIRVSVLDFNTVSHIG